MHQHIQPTILLCITRYTQRFPLRPTSGTPGDVYEEGFEVFHAVDAFVEVVEAGFGFGGEEFKGEVGGGACAGGG